jgi:hypothetical protein
MKEAEKRRVYQAFLKQYKLPHSILTVSNLGHGTTRVINQSKIKLELSLCTAYGEVEAYLYSFLTSAL